MERSYVVHIDVPTVDGWEILRQLIDGKHPIIYRCSTILSVIHGISQPLLTIINHH